MSDQSRARLWAMWAAVKSFSEISRAIGYPPGSVFTVIKQTGGYVRPPRKRRSDALAEREEISRGLARKESVRQIARRLGRAASTVGREITRNRGRRTSRGVDADDGAWRRARRPKACPPARDPLLRAYVAARLGEDWSPEQIAGALAKDAPDRDRSAGVARDDLQVAVRAVSRSAGQRAAETPAQRASD